MRLLKLVGAFALLGLTCEPLGFSRHAVAAPAKTRVSVVDPVSSTGLTPGFHVIKTIRTHDVHRNDIICEPGSEAFPGAVYRCFPRNRVLDPCWADPRDARDRTVVCPVHPWSTRMIRIRMHQRLAHEKGRPVAHRDEPWGLELTTGKRASIFEGAHDSFHGRAVDYDIGYTKDGRYHLEAGVLRGLNRRHQPWTAAIVNYHCRHYHCHLTHGGHIAITQVWFGDGD